MSIPMVDLADLGVLEHHRDHRETSDYTVERRPGVLLKQYHDPRHIDFSELNRLCARVDQFKHPYRRHASAAAWPTGVVVDRGRRFAVMVPRYDARFTAGGQPRRLTELIEPPMRGDAERVVAASERIAIVRLLVQYVAALHHKSIVLGGISPERILRSATEPPELFVLDCDRYRIIGYPAARPRRGDRLPSTRDDCRELCLVTAKILLGRPDLTSEVLATDPEVKGRFDSEVRRLLDEVAAGSPWPLTVRWRRALDQGQVLNQKEAA